MIRHRWRTHLKSATTEAAVVDLIDAYLAEWRREEIESLPPGAWPGDIRDRAAIMSSMFRIGEVHSRFRGDAASLARLQELLLVFTHAAVRVTQIAAHPGEPPPANDAPDPDSVECARPGRARRWSSGA